MKRWDEGLIGRYVCGAVTAHEDPPHYQALIESLHVILISKSFSSLLPENVLLFRREQALRNSWQRKTTIQPSLLGEQRNDCHAPDMTSTPTPVPDKDEAQSVHEAVVSIHELSRQTEIGNNQQRSPSVPYRQIRAFYDDKTITVYQAYSAAIAVPAVSDQKLCASPDFKLGRMTWIKPQLVLDDVNTHCFSSNIS